jgi:hypothetical protein
MTACFSRYTSITTSREVSEDLSDLKIGLDLMTEEQFKSKGISAETSTLSRNKL